MTRSTCPGRAFFGDPPKCLKAMTEIYMLNLLEISRSVRAAIHGRPHVSRRKCDVPRFQWRRRICDSLKLMGMWSIGTQPIEITNMISEPNPIYCRRMCCKSDAKAAETRHSSHISCTCICCADMFCSGVRDRRYSTRSKIEYRRIETGR